MEIQINRKTLMWGGVIVLLLIAVIVFFLPSSGTASTPTSVNIKSATPAQVAETMARLFHTVDYQRPSAWLEAMQPYSSDEGVKIMRDVVAPAIFPEFERLKTKSEAKQVKATWKKLLSLGYSKTANMDWELHLVEITLDPAVKWPGSTGTFTTNVLLNKTPNGWRFTSFFSDEVAKTLIEAQPTKPVAASTPAK